MFDNIGGKIKGVAKVTCWIGIIASVISGLVMMIDDEDMIAIALLTILVGALASWVGSFMVYGFGQLVENSDTLVAQSKQNGVSLSVVTKKCSDMVTILENQDNSTPS